MKKLATLIVACSPALLWAQPTLQQSMVDPNGSLLDLHVLTDPGTAQEPSDGANQTWDLSSVTLQLVGTLNFTPAANTPYAATYPAANWAWVSTPAGLGSDFLYLNIGSSGIEVVATDVPSTPDPYTDTKKIMAFPMTLGQSLTDNYTDMDGPATVTWTYSGHGTAITPIGTFTNVVKLVSTEDDMVLWNTAPLHPIVIDDGSGVLFFGPGNLGIADAGATEPLAAYPNPCTDELNVTAAGNSTWRITDLQGRTVRSGRTIATGTQRIAVNDLVAGAYLVVLDGPQGPRVARFTKQ